MGNIDKMVKRLAGEVSFLTKSERVLYAKALKEAIVWAAKTK
jgi:hypothetical protein